MGDDDPRGEERAEGAAEIAADLKEGLSETMASAGSEAGHAGGFRMKNSGAQTDDAGGEQNEFVTRREGEGDQTEKSEAHADNERIRFWIAVGIKSDERLKDGAGHLKDERDHADLREGQAMGVFQQGIGSGNERLQGVVDQMGNAEREEDAERVSRRLGRRGRVWRGLYYRLWIDLSLGIHGKQKALPPFGSRAGQNRLSLIWRSAAHPAGT